MIRILTRHVVVRYIISGGTSASVDLILLYLLNTIFGMHYLFAAILAFIGAFFVSFVLQKFWTFKDHSTTDMHKQAVMYLGTSLFGLSLNTLLMYIFVGYFGLFVILSQVFAGILVACCTFFLSRNLVFKYSHEREKKEVTVQAVEQI